MFLPSLHDMTLFFWGVIFMFVLNLFVGRSIMQSLLQQFLTSLEQFAFSTAIQFAQTKADQVNQAITNGATKAAQQVHDQIHTNDQ